MIKTNPYRENRLPFYSSIEINCRDWETKIIINHSVEHSLKIKCIFFKSSHTETFILYKSDITLNT